MPFKTVKSIEDKNKLIKEFLKNREALKQKLLEKKLGDQELARATEEIYQPVTKSVERAQKKTDENQDKMIEQLKENQENITEAIDTLSEAVSKSGSVPRGLENWVGGLPSQFDPIEEEEEGAVGGIPKQKTTEQPIFNKLESKRIEKSGFDPNLIDLPSNYVIDNKIIELNQGLKNTTSPSKKSLLANQKLTLQKYKKVVSDVRKEKSKQVKADTEVWKPPFAEEDTIEFIPDEDVLESSKKKGTGLKLSSDHMFGNIHIDPSKLLQMRLEAYNNNGKKVISKKIDDDLIHLLTKRYNPKRSYSEHSQKTFNKLID